MYRYYIFNIARMTVSPYHRCTWVELTCILCINVHLRSTVNSTSDLYNNSIFKSYLPLLIIICQSCIISLPSHIGGQCIQVVHNSVYNVFWINESVDVLKYTLPATQITNKSKSYFFWQNDKNKPLC